MYQLVTEKGISTIVSLTNFQSHMILRLSPPPGVRIFCFVLSNLCQEISDYVISGKRLVIPESAPGPLQSLISDCWDQDPEKRPGKEFVFVV